MKINPKNMKEKSDAEKLHYCGTRPEYCERCRFQTPPMDLAAGKKWIKCEKHGVVAERSCSECNREKDLPEMRKNAAENIKRLENALPKESPKWEKEFAEKFTDQWWHSTQGYMDQLVLSVLKRIKVPVENNDKRNELLKSFISRVEQSAREEKEEALRMMRESEIEDLARVKKESYAA